MPEEIKDPNPPSQPGVGETTQEQAPPAAAEAPKSSLCRERMMEVIRNTQMTQKAAQAVLDIVNANPDLDGQFCLLFGIKPHDFNMPRR